MENFRVAWWDQPNNFGDVLTPLLLDHFGIKYHRVKPEEVKLIVVGSIARFALKATIVLGSGIIRKGENLHPGATWDLVRGPLTKERVEECGGSCSGAMGDPALLVPLLAPGSPKRNGVGLVPHYSHFKEARTLRHSFKVIDVTSENPLKVAQQISGCKKIVSSSLHGIICAHAYGIPAAWVSFSRKLHGDGSKFMDYYGSVGLEPNLSTMKNPLFSLPEKINQDPIIDAFQSLK